MKKISLLVFYCCLVVGVSAQYYSNRNKVWAFGSSAGLDFTSTPPVSFTTSAYAGEGCASVCNSAGQLLFYTDGRTVYDKLGALMPGGFAIVPFYTFSSTQGALIVPFIGDTNKYYIFSVEMHESPGRKLMYSVVDMTLNGGLGDLVTGSTAIIIDTQMSEKLISVPGENCNIWLLAHKNDTAQFYAYEITSTGISTTPVISNVGTLNGLDCYAIGVMKCSPNRHKIVTASWPVATSSGFELYDFNPITGIVSNCQVLEANVALSKPYGAEFSPDNTKLYTSDQHVAQWNISLPTTAAIIASKTLLYSPPTSSYFLSDLKTGADAKIYINHAENGAYLDCINFPNVAGTACGYSDSAINLSPNMTWYGFPNLVWDILPWNISGDTSICSGATISFTAPMPGGIWTSSSPSIATVNPSGVVTGISTGTTVINYATGTLCNGSTVITVNPAPAPIKGATNLCIGESITLTCATSGGSWSVTSGIASINPTTGVLTGITPGFVNISYTISTGCTALRTDTVKQCYTVVDHLYSDKHTSLYPNPATNEITITADPSTFTSVTIYSALGQDQIKCEITGTEMKVDVKALPPGQYLVVFKGDTQREIARFVKW